MIFISTQGLQFRRFLFSARDRCAKATRAAYEHWPEYAKEQQDKGLPVQERWSYAVDRGLEHMVDATPQLEEPS